MENSSYQHYRYESDDVFFLSFLSLYLLASVIVVISHEGPLVHDRAEYVDTPGHVDVRYL